MTCMPGYGSYVVPSSMHWAAKQKDLVIGHNCTFEVIRKDFSAW